MDEFDEIVADLEPPDEMTIARWLGEEVANFISKQFAGKKDSPVVRGLARSKANERLRPHGFEVDELRVTLKQSGGANYHLTFKRIEDEG